MNIKLVKCVLYWDTNHADMEENTISKTREI